MPQLHTYLTDEEAARLREEAKAAGVSVSRLIAARLRTTKQDGWPEGFFKDVIGSWCDEPLERPPQGEFERRPEL